MIGISHRVPAGFYDRVCNQAGHDDSVTRAWGACAAVMLNSAMFQPGRVTYRRRRTQGGDFSGSWLWQRKAARNAGWSDRNGPTRQASPRTALRSVVKAAPRAQVAHAADSSKALPSPHPEKGETKRACSERSNASACEHPLPAVERGSPSRRRLARPHLFTRPAMCAVRSL